MMHNRKRLCAGLVATTIIAGWLISWTIVDHNHCYRLCESTHDLNGTDSSVTPQFPFSGSQIMLAFRNIDFAENDLLKLTETLKPCANHFVVIHFQNTNATKREVDKRRYAIPNCRVIFDNYRKDTAQLRIQNAG